MLDVLHFIFSSFWVWLGSMILLGILTGAGISLLSSILAMFGGKKQ